MSKEITKGHEARLKIKAGMDKACDAVRPTLGAVGMTAMIDFPGLDPIECDDGVTILKNIEFKDPYENMGVKKLKKAAIRTSTEGGDGTATTTVLTQALVSEAVKAIANDSSLIREVSVRLSAGLVETLAFLNTQKRDVSEADMERIATISSLDPEMAQHIAETIKAVGINGAISVEKGHTIGYSREIVNGARFDRGLISPFFITDHERIETVLEDAYIILVDRKVSTNEQIIPLLNAIGTGKSILLIADDVDSVALGTLAQNALRGIAKIACVRNPMSASAGRDFLSDIAAITGATVISEESGMKMSEVGIEVCGRAQSVVITKDQTTIVGGLGGSALAPRIESVKNQIATETSEFNKERLNQRLAMLDGGIGVIRVGAYTDTEFNAKKYKFVNAINATQAALQEGILPGGGIALLDASTHSTDQMFREALIAPFMQMAVNAGMKNMEGYRFIARPFGTGINFKTKEDVVMFDTGIIDPFKVTRLALESAVAIAISMISVETAIVNEVENENGN